MSAVRKSLVKHIVWLLAVAVIIYSVGIKSNVVKAVRLVKNFVSG